MVPARRGSGLQRLARAPRRRRMQQQARPLARAGRLDGRGASAGRVAAYDVRPEDAVKHFLNIFGNLVDIAPYRW